MSKKKIVGSKFKIGDKVIIKNRPNPNRGALGFSGEYHVYRDGEIGVIVRNKDNSNVYYVRLAKDKSNDPLLQGIFEKDLIKA